MTDLQKEILFNDGVIAINQDVTPQGKPIVRVVVEELNMNALAKNYIW